MTTFTVRDVQQAQCTLEPLICLNPECSEPEPSVIYNSMTCDAVCEHCGESQEQFL